MDSKLISVVAFRSLIWDFYSAYQRSMPWRDEPTPYHVLLSEMMLQQTQVERVKLKYTAWLEQWPTLHDLADASTIEVLEAWQGLGYNRRAL